MAVKTIGIVRGAGHHQTDLNNVKVQDESADFIAVTPADTARLCAAGLDVWIEEGAGIDAGFEDVAYAIAGASVESRLDILKNCDFIAAASTLDLTADLASGIALKQDVILCSPAVTADGCDHSFHFLNTLEMRESPKIQSDMEILGRTAMAEALAPYIATASMASLDIRILGWSPLMRYALRRAGNRDPKSIELVPAGSLKKDLTALGTSSLYIYDSRHFEDGKKLIPFLKSKGCHLFDLKDFVDDQGDLSVQVYREDHPPYDMGGLLIDFNDLAGTTAISQAIDLFKSQEKNIGDLNVVVIGYDPYVQAALDALKSAGVGTISLLGRKNVSGENLAEKLAQADIILIGKIKLPQARGAIFDENILSSGLKDGAVILDFAAQGRIKQDWVKGCTQSFGSSFLGQNGIYLAQGINWGQLAPATQVSNRFSEQLTEILIGEQKLASLMPSDYPNGVKQALASV